MNVPFRSSFIVVLFVFLLATAPAQKLSAQQMPKGAKLAPEFSSDGVKVYAHEQTLWLVLDPDVVKAGRAELPRVCASIRSMGWKGHADAPLKFVPEPKQWVFSWKKNHGSVIEVVFDSAPLLLRDLAVAAPAGDGSVMLHAHQARTFGEKLRFEPQPHKNTVGYWSVASDYATWKLNIEQPGTFTVAVLLDV